MDIAWWNIDECKQDVEWFVPKYVFTLFGLFVRNIEGKLHILMRSNYGWSFVRTESTA